MSTHQTFLSLSSIGGRFLTIFWIRCIRCFGERERDNQRPPYCIRDVSFGGVVSFVLDTTTALLHYDETPFSIRSLLSLGHEGLGQRGRVIHTQRNTQELSFRHYSTRHSSSHVQLNRSRDIFEMLSFHSLLPTPPLSPPTLDSSDFSRRKQAIRIAIVAHPSPLHILPFLPPFLCACPDKDNA